MKKTAQAPKKGGAGRISCVGVGGSGNIALTSIPTILSLTCDQVDLIHDVIEKVLIPHVYLVSTIMDAFLMS